MKEIFKRHPRYAHAPEDFSSIPENLWIKCPRCQEMLYAREHEQALRVCSKCKYHFQIGARERIEMTLDPGSFAEEASDVRSGDPLRFHSPGRSYADRLGEYREESGTNEAFLYGTGTIESQPVVIGV